MRTYEGFVFSKEESGFRKYIKHFAPIFYTRADIYKYNWTEDIESSIEAYKFVHLDKTYKSLLSEDELKAIEFAQYHNPDIKRPKDYEKSLKSAYPKWYSVFFGEQDPIFGIISPVLIGKEIEILRFKNCINQSELASMVGVNRTTIIDVEKGERLPSLELMHKIAVIFKITIDELIQISLIK